MRLLAISLLLAACGDAPSEPDDPATPPDSDDVVETDVPDTEEPAAPDLDGDGAGSDVDCDDGDATVYPGAPELCDGVDSDCDGSDDGAVSLHPDDGEPEALAGGEGDAGPWVIDKPGTVILCPGTRSGRLHLAVDGITVRPHDTATLPVLDGGDASAIQIAAGVTDVLVQGVTLSGGGARGGGLHVEAGARAVLEDVVVADALVSDAGGAIYVGIDATLEATRLTMAETVADQGGGLFVDERGQAALVDVTVREVGALVGGGVYAGSDATLSIEGGTFSDGVADQGAGIAAMDASSVSLLSVTLTEQYASVDGGGLYLRDVAEVVLGGEGMPVEIEMASAESGSGGGLWLSGESVIIRELSVLGGTAAGAGGGGYIAGGEIDAVGLASEDGSALEGGGFYLAETRGFIYDISAVDGEATRGGGLFLRDSANLFLGVTLSGNASMAVGGHGGALAVEGGTPLMVGGEIAENQAERGGAIDVRGDAHLTTDDVSCFDNTADYGGAIQLSDAMFTLEYGVWERNTATQEGGLAYVEDGGQLGFDFNTVQDNTAPVGGAISLREGGTVSFLGATFLRNTATEDSTGGVVHIYGGGLTVVSADLSEGDDDNQPSDLYLEEGPSYRYGEVQGVVCFPTYCTDEGLAP